MPEFLSINQVGLKGLNTDLSPWELPPEFISSGKNFRVLGDRIISAGSSETYDTPTTAFTAGRNTFVKTPSAEYWMVFGRNDVYVFDGASWTEISSGAYAGISTDGELNWTMAMLGIVPIVNNPAHYPEYWSPQSAGQVLQALPFDASNTWSDKSYTCQVIRAHKNVLLALNLSEGAVELPHSYRWSHPADNNGIPFSWDEQDDSALAGKAQLGGHTGSIVDGLSLRDSFIVYSETGINVLDWTGDEFVWRRRELSSSYGALTKDCIAEIDGNHFILTDGDILINNGNSIDSIIHNRIRTRMLSNMNADYYHRSFVVKFTAKKELWFCVTEDNAQYPNVAYVYNWKDDAWSIHDLPDNIAFAAYGPKGDPVVTYADQTISYAEATSSYGAQQGSPNDDNIIGVDISDSSLIVLEPENTVAEITDTELERLQYPLLDHDSVFFISRVYPYMDGVDDVSIQFGTHDYVGGPVTWGVEHTFNPSTDRKIDVRITGKLLAWRIKSKSTGKLEFSGFGIEVSRAGKR